MHARFALALSGTLLGATSALAASPTVSDWAIDFSTARVLHLDPIVIGGMSGDRIVFDVRRKSDDVKGTLSVSCTANEYGLWTAESQLVSDAEPLSDWPLAAQLAASFCKQIDHLPQADKMTPLDIKSE